MATKPAAKAKAPAKKAAAPKTIAAPAKKSAPPKKAAAAKTARPAETYALKAVFADIAAEQGIPKKQADAVLASTIDAITTHLKKWRSGTHGWPRHIGGQETRGADGAQSCDWRIYPDRRQQEGGVQAC